MRIGNKVQRILRSVFRLSTGRLIIGGLLAVAGIALLLYPAWQRNLAHQQIADWGGVVYETSSVSTSAASTIPQRARRAYWQWIERMFGTSFTDSCVRVEFTGTAARDEDLLFLAKCSELRSVFVNNADVGDRLVAALCKLPQLYTINLEGTLVTDAGLEYLSNCRSLGAINVTETYATRAGVAKLQAALPTAEIVWGTSASDAHWHAQRQLARAGISVAAEGKRFGEEQPNEFACTVTLGTGEVFLDQILPLADLEGNVRLRAIQTICPPEMCDFLGSLRNVVSLTVAYVEFPGDLDWIAMMPNLYELSIEYTVGKQHDLSFLGSMTNLRRLTFRRIQFVDEDVLRLPPGMPLEQFRARDSRITDASMDRIASFKQLRWLDLSGTAITDAGAVKLAGLQQLERLYITRTSVGDDTVAAINQLPKLRVLWLGHTQVTAAGLQKLAAVESLSRLRVRNSDVGFLEEEMIQQFESLDSFVYDRADDGSSE